MRRTALRPAGRWTPPNVLVVALAPLGFFALRVYATADAARRVLAPPHRWTAPGGGTSIVKLTVPPAVVAGCAALIHDVPDAFLVQAALPTVPQHGDGPKHGRRIALETWQMRQLEQAPWSFLRGCIRSDGCVFVNRTGPYSYLSYDFCNKSQDIIELFTEACRLVGVGYRLTCWRGRFRVRINRRGSVKRMLKEVGVKG